VKRFLVVLPMTFALTGAGLSFAGIASAASPPGSGQPSQECGSDKAPDSPSGLNSGGFAHAETVYAGSDGTPSAANAQSGSAVSQYDVACFQVSQH
jgi:hypothetical protein